MAAPEQQVPSRTSPPAHIVGSAFVDQYYHMLHESPELVHRFYQDISKFGRPEESGIMGITTTMEDINKKILSLGYDELSVEIMSVDAQESHGGGVLVLVTGYIIGKDNIKQKFTQCFFLAPQEKGYFVLNDILRYVNDNESQGCAHDSKSPVTSDHVEDPSVRAMHASEQISKIAVVGDEEEVHNVEMGEASVEEAEALIPEAFDEIPDDSKPIAGSASSDERVPKKSYASIVKVMRKSERPSSTAVTSVVASTKSQEQQGTLPLPPSSSEANGSETNTKEIANTQEAEAEGYSIHVKGLSPNTTPSLLESVFKKFGPIKNGGIQVRSQKGFCFGFVEFEVASAAQSALEASPILIEGHQVLVEEKRSTTRVNSRGRFPSGRRPVYRSDGTRERGTYGNGRSYGRGDPNMKGEFGGYRNGNQGGFFNHGGDRYQRGNHSGANGGRRNRSGGLAGTSAVKTTDARVAASA
ncbi:hypothetical protein PIB30_006449 [Stylosanthes scabra]|uniref:G3BP-like protein n=1 Tax=Stylosanthes scabra TaxID=79078 RepID=A0ABU6U6D2_9FABA|nr:hypothetical protein [Stylosanthes scabra]